jgi:hypothetical protein
MHLKYKKKVFWDAYYFIGMACVTVHFRAPICRMISEQWIESFMEGIGVA